MTSLKSYDTIDVFRGIGAAIILLVIIGIFIHYYQIEEERLQQEDLQAKEGTWKTRQISNNYAQ